MNHVTYALFDDEAHARAALAEIEAGAASGRHCEAALHRGHLDEGRIGLAETGASQGFREGAAIGAIGGALLGAVLFGPPGVPFAAAGAAVGTLYGAMAGALGGAGSPDRRLERLSHELARGKVLLIVEAPSLAARDEADDAARANGGHVEHKSFV